MLVILAAFALIFSFSYSAEAQYLTQDVIFLKVGYIPVYTVTYKEDEGIKPDDTESAGLAIQAEYNLNFNGFWLGFGLEYQNVKSEINKDFDEITNQFILPEVSAKVAAVGGLYVGGGLSGKYLIATDVLEAGTYEIEAQKKIDLWLNGIVGYYVPVGEGIFIDFEGRFGWNLTNNQFKEIDVTETTSDVTVTEKQKPESAYDMAFYIGVGFRPLGSEY